MRKTKHWRFGVDDEIFFLPVNVYEVKGAIHRILFLPVQRPNIVFHHILCLLTVYLGVFRSDSARLGKCLGGGDDRYFYHS